MLITSLESDEKRERQKLRMVHATEEEKWQGKGRTPIIWKRVNEMFGEGERKKTQRAPLPGVLETDDGVGFNSSKNFHVEVGGIAASPGAFHVCATV